jgi:glucose/mannose-6-phosphate isomerase
MHTPDHSSFYQIISNFPQQIEEAPGLIKNLDLKVVKKNYDHLIFLGMGGSAIAGDFLKCYLHQEFPIPFLVNRNYTLPDFIGPKTLVIACSYSGDTEETIAATKTAIKAKAAIIGVSSGGKLEKVMKDEQRPFLKIPAGYPPRQALGYMFFPVLNLFQRLGLIKHRTHDISEVIKILKELRERNHPERTHSHNLCNHIAQKLYKKIPVIYTASEFLYPVVVRWRNQFNENSKMLAFSNVIPELTHNEIMGWEASTEILNNFNVIFLRDESETARNRKRLEITKEIFKKNKIAIFEVFGEGKSVLSQIFSLVYIGDWVSYYLALIYDKDPYKINSIQFLKDSLSRFQEKPRVKRKP